MVWPMSEEGSAISGGLPTQLGSTDANVRLQPRTSQRRRAASSQLYQFQIGALDQCQERDLPQLVRPNARLTGHLEQHLAPRKRKQQQPTGTRRHSDATTAETGAMPTARAKTCTEIFSDAHGLTRGGHFGLLGELRPRRILRRRHSHGFFAFPATLPGD